MYSAREKDNPASKTFWPVASASALIVACLLLESAPRAASIAGAFTAFDVPGAGKDSGEGTSPQSMNEAGEITGNYKDQAGAVHGFVRHRDGTFTTFDVPGASKRAGLGTSPQGINQAGEVAGYYFTDPQGVRHGFVRHKDGSIMKFDPTGTLGTVVQSINAGGDITGNYVANDVAHGFIGHRDGTFTSFDPPHSFNTAPTNINSRGDVAGYYEDENGVLHGFLRRSDGTFTEFAAPGANTAEGRGTFAMTMNDDGEIAGYYYSGANNAVHGFLRHPNGTFTTFDTPGAITDTRSHTDEEGYIVRAVTTPQGINQAGELAGYYGDAKGVVHGFVRHKDGAFDSFDAPGASHTGDLGTFIMSINKNGDLAGFFYAAQGDLARGFVLKRPPAPGAAAPPTPKKPN